MVSLVRPATAIYSSQSNKWQGQLFYEGHRFFEMSKVKPDPGAIASGGRCSILSLIFPLGNLIHPHLSIVLGPCQMPNAASNSESPLARRECGI